MKKRLISILFTGATVLAACTPPPPPELIAALQERDVYCGIESVRVLVNDAILFPFDDAIESYRSFCEGVEVLVSSEEVNPDIVISDLSLADVKMCDSKIFMAPVALEAAVIVFNLSGLDSLNFSPEIIAGIFNGDITKWSDPALARANESIELPDTDIKVSLHSKNSASEVAFFNWIEKNMDEGVISYTNEINQFETTQEIIDEIYSEEGTLAIIPHNLALDSVLPIGNLLIDGELIFSDASGFASGASQVSWTEESGSLIPKLDPEREVTVAAGSEEAGLPYQGLGFYQMGICTTNYDESIAAVARFLLRQDAQGTLDIYGITPLSEPLRLKSAELFGRPLPQPEIDLAEFDFE